MSVTAAGRPAGPAKAAPLRGARAGVALGTVATCNAMIQLDDAIVNIAVPGMIESLGLSTVGASWVLNSYLLAFGGLLLLGGRAGDILGRRRVFLAGVGLFTAAAAVRGLAPSGEFLVTVRAVQGVGAALAAPSGLALVLSMFAEGPRRKRAIAVCTAVGAVSTAGGLLLAGALTAASSWRWVLYLNVPLGLVVLALTPLVVPETARNRGRFDLAGALVSALGAASLVYGLARAADHGWSDAFVVGCIGAGCGLLLVFVRIERRAEQPIVLPRLFAARDRVCAYAATLAVPGALMGTYFFLNQFFQRMQGYGPLAAAVALTPLAVTMAGMAGVAVRLEREIGPKRLMAVGAGLLLAGNLWLSLLTTSGGYAERVLPALLLLGAGMAFCVIPPTLIATSGLRSGEAGAASSVLNAVQTLGGSLGLAALVTVASHASRAAEAPAGADAGAAQAHAFTEGMSASFTAAAVFAGVALVAAACIRRAGRRG